MTNPPDKGAGDIVSLSILCVQYSGMECFFRSRVSACSGYHRFIVVVTVMSSWLKCVEGVSQWDAITYSEETDAGLGWQGEKRDERVSGGLLCHLERICWKNGKLRSVQSQDYKINKGAELMF